MLVTRQLRSLLLITGTCAALAMPLHAGVAVSPLKQEISLRPGEQGKITLTLTNNARGDFDAPQAMHIELADVQISEDGALALPPPGRQPNSAGKWITLGQTNLTLDPGKSQTVDITISPPPTASAGEYYSAVLVTLANPGRTSKGLIVQYRVASGVFVTVLGRTFPKQARITRSDWLWPSPATPSSTAPATQANPDLPPLPTLAVVLQNTGQARFDASGRILILNDQMRIVFRTALTSPRPCIFGGDARVFEATLSKALPPGKYMVRIAMDYESAWASAHQELPLEITPQQAAAWARNDPGGHDDSALVETVPAKVSTIIYAGGTRSLALAVSNISDNALQCRASLAPTDNTWLTLSPDVFSLPKSGRRSIELQLAIPPQAIVGKYTATLVIDATAEGTPKHILNVPVEFEVKSEKP